MHFDVRLAKLIKWDCISYPHSKHRSNIWIALGWFRTSFRLFPYPLVNYHSNGKSPFWMGKSTISMAIFNCKLLVHQRVFPSFPFHFPSQVSKVHPAMGGAPYLAVIYRNAAVVRLAGRFAGVTRDARALQRCRELAKGAADAPGGAEMAVGKALWDAEAGDDWHDWKVVECVGLFGKKSGW